METNPLDLVTMYPQGKDLRYSGRLAMLVIRTVARLDLYSWGIFKHVSPSAKQIVATNDIRSISNAVFLTDPNGDRVTDSRRGALEFSTWHGNKVAALYWIAAYGPPLQAARAFRIIIAYGAWHNRRHGIAATYWPK